MLCKKDILELRIKNSPIVREKEASTRSRAGFLSDSSNCVTGTQFPYIRQLHVPPGQHLLQEGVRSGSRTCVVLAQQPQWERKASFSIHSQESLRTPSNWVSLIHLLLFS